jgi:hypothetical protein
MCVHTQKQQIRGSVFFTLGKIPKIYLHTISKMFIAKPLKYYKIGIFDMKIHRHTIWQPCTSEAMLRSEIWGDFPFPIKSNFNVSFLVNL